MATVDTCNSTSKVKGEQCFYRADTCNSSSEIGAGVYIIYTLNLTFLIGSSQRGPSLVPHWKPCTIESFTVDSRDLST